MRLKHPYFLPPFVAKSSSFLSEVANRKKQIAALLMLSLFLVIQGVKLLHAHEDDSCESITPKTELVTKTKHCDICDYHFATALSSPTYTASLIAGPEIPFYFNHYRSVPITSTGLSYSDRGPPALV